MKLNFPSITLAYQSLLRQRRRTILTMLAISIGISAVITINAAGKGIQRFVLGQLDIFGADTFHLETQVPAGKGSAVSAVGISITTLKEKDVQTLLKHPNISYAYGEVTGQDTVSYNGQIKKILLLGNGWSMPEVQKVDLTEGRFYTKEEEDSLAQVAVLGSKAKDKLFGEDSATDKIIYIHGKAFRVIGSLAPRGAAFFFDLDNVIMLPTKTMQKRLLGIDYYQSISGRFKSVDKAASTAEEVSADLRANHSITDPTHDDFVVRTTIEAQKSLTTVTDGLTLLLVALVCISLIVGGVGIMNIMYVSVAERTFEIGLRKALGAKSKNILRQFLAEAVLITLGGGIIGVLLGVVFAYIIYFAATSFGIKWVYAITVQSVALAIGFSAVIGLFFGLYPAEKASKLNPIDALRKE